MRNIVSIAFLSFLISCSNTTIEEELKNTKIELTAANATIKNLKTQVEPEGKLVHTVLIKLKSDADAAALGVELNKLKNIAVVKDFQFGFFEDLEDELALSEYSMMLEMSFDDKTEYDIYVEHPIHIAAQEAGAQYIASPPVSFDYIKEE